MRKLIGAVLGAAMLAGTSQAAEPVVPKFMFMGVHVVNLERAVTFYKSVLGMKEVERKSPGNLLEALMNYSGTRNDSFVVLVENKSNKEPYIRGTSFGYIGIKTPDVKQVMERCKAFTGCKITKEPDPAAVNLVAMMSDLDGFTYEVIQYR